MRLLCLPCAMVLMVLASCTPTTTQATRTFSVTFGGQPKGTTCTVIGAAGTVKQVKAPIFGDPGVTISGAPEVGTIECRAPDGTGFQTRLNGELMLPGVSFASAIVTSAGYVQGTITEGTRRYTFTGNTTITKL